MNNFTRLRRLSLFSGSLLMALCVTQSAHAAEFVWTGAAEKPEVWTAEFPLNWDIEAMPGADDTVVFDNVDSGKQRTVTLFERASIKELKINQTDQARNAIQLAPGITLTVNQPIDLHRPDNARHTQLRMGGNSELNARQGLNIGRGGLFIASMPESQMVTVRGDVAIENGGLLQLWREPGGGDSTLFIDGSLRVDKQGTIHFTRRKGADYPIRIGFKNGGFTMNDGTLEMLVGCVPNAPASDLIVGDGTEKLIITDSTLALTLGADFDYNASYPLFINFSDIDISNLRITGHSPAYTPVVDKNGVLKFTKR